MLLKANHYRLDLSQPKIMGIVNITPDSFSDGGQYSDIARAIEHAQQLVEEGADIIDLGGESTRPNAQLVSAELEIKRVIPVLQKLRQHLSIPISIDTFKPELMRIAISEGADIINDVNALQAEGAMEAVCCSDVAVCLMHKQGQPQTMQQAPVYKDVFSEVYHFLQQRIDSCLEQGVLLERLCIDPGFGFGKTLAHNNDLLVKLSAFSQLQRPILVGLSRKSMIGEITGEARADLRLGGSIAAACIAVANGARIVRVHDVKQTKQALAVWQACAV